MNVDSATALRWIRPTGLTLLAVTATAVVMAFSAAFLAAAYAALPELLPVRFAGSGVASGWQFKTFSRVLMPVFVQAALAVTLGAVGALLLSRSHGTHDEAATDVKAASVAAECVALMTLIWVAFQGYAAVALVAMWQRERGGLGGVYTYLEAAGIVITFAVAVRAHRRVGGPPRRPFVAEHWRLGQLYRNPGDPALFVPTRDGGHWTVNFGRPVTVMLMVLVLGIGILGPTVILGLFLR